MELNKLIKIVKNLELIKSVDDINSLFVNYSIINSSSPLEKNFKNAFKWAYDNDLLEDFYLEHLDVLIESDISDMILGCEIITNSSIRTTTTFEIYLFESNKKEYYKVIANGDNADCLDWEYGFYEVRDKPSKKEMIKYFKEVCNDVFTNNGEFDFDELMKEGHEISFY